MSNEKLLREAKIAKIREDIKINNFKTLKILEDLRSYLDPVDVFPDISKIKIEKAEILWEELKQKISETRQLKEQAEWIEGQ